MEHGADGWNMVGLVPLVGVSWASYLGQGAGTNWNFIASYSRHATHTRFAPKMLVAVW